MDRLIADEAGTLTAGAALAEACPREGMIIHLVGELGAGKTTLVRGFMRGLGYGGPVKSPTYTLLESYEVAGRRIHHFDLYRLADPGELEYLGIRDCLDEPAVLLIEWPVRGGRCVPAADLVLRLEQAGTGRRLQADALTVAGHRLLAAVDHPLQPRVD